MSKRREIIDTDWLLRYFDVKIAAQNPKSIARAVLRRMRWELEASTLVGSMPLRPAILDEKITDENLDAYDEANKAYRADRNAWNERALAALPEDD